MHIDSQRKDHGLLTQMHGSFQPIGFGEFDFDEELKKTETSFYARSKSNKGIREETVNCYKVLTAETIQVLDGKYMRK